MGRDLVRLVLEDDRFVIQGTTIGGKMTQTVPTGSPLIVYDLFRVMSGELNKGARANAFMVGMVDSVRTQVGIQKLCAVQLYLIDSDLVDRAYKQYCGVNHANFNDVI